MAGCKVALSAGQLSEQAVGKTQGVGFTKQCDTSFPAKISTYLILLMIICIEFILSRHNTYSSMGNCALPDLNEFFR